MVYNRHINLTPIITEDLIMSRKTTLILAIVFGLILFGIGLYLSFFQTRGFIRTTAKIEQIEETWTGTDEDGRDQYDHEVWVSYTVDGVTRQSRLDTWSSDYEVGKRIRIYYDPADPEKIHGDSRKLGMVLWIAGPVLAIVSTVTLVRDSRKKEEPPVV